MSLKERAIKNWRTSVIGLGLVLAAVVSVFTSGVSWVDAIVPISLGLGFIFSKDEWVNKVIKIVLIGLFVSCNPVKQVLRDQEKFDIVAEEVIRRGKCVNDTVVITKVKDSIVYKDSIIERINNVPCKDFDTTIGRARIRVSSGVLIYTSKDSVVYRTKTVTKIVKDRSLEGLLKADIQNRDSVINSRTAEILDLKNANAELEKDIIAVKLKFWLLIISALVIIFRKQIVGLVWRSLK